MTVYSVPSVVIDHFPVIRMTVYHRVTDLSSFNYMDTLCSHTCDCLRPKHKLELIWKSSWLSVVIFFTFFEYVYRFLSGCRFRVNSQRLFPGKNNC